jgi:UDP-N-acetylglucosamine:LPS N-acetylglucosamine transferase
MALAAAGTTCWELAHLGIPAILVTESPGIVAQSLKAAGAARWLGHETGVTAKMMADALAALVSDSATRRAMADAGRRLVDGKGAKRAAALIEELCR